MYLIDYLSLLESDYFFPVKTHFPSNMFRQPRPLAQVSTSLKSFKELTEAEKQVYEDLLASLDKNGEEIFILLPFQTFLVVQKFSDTD